MVKRHGGKWELEVAHKATIPDIGNFPFQRRQHMPCGFCGDAHNRRTCKKFNVAEVARMLVEGQAQDAVYGPYNMAY